MFLIDFMYFVNSDLFYCLCSFVYIYTMSPYFYNVYIIIYDHCTCAVAFHKILHYPSDYNHLLMSVFSVDC